MSGKISASKVSMQDDFGAPLVEVRALGGLMWISYFFVGMQGGLNGAVVPHLPGKPMEKSSRPTFPCSAPGGGPQYCPIPHPPTYAAQTCEQSV